MKAHFNFPADVQEAFTFGDCWHLAGTIRILTDLPIITAQWEENERSLWCHVANRLPDGRIIDIEGIWEEEEWLQNWHIRGDTFFIDKEDRIMFVKEWNKAEWAEELKDCDFDLYYPEISQRVTTYAKEILTQIN